MRYLGRKNHELRNITIETNFIKNSDGSCLISYGDTKVICTASIEDKAPLFLSKNSGWVTAEYSMLPGSNLTRTKRESIAGKQTGRTQEIQRLISRSLRAAIDLKLLGSRQIIIDCDVINADGGTRTASITGGYIALALAINKLVKNNLIKSNPIKKQIASVACGIVEGQILVDLDYKEDFNAEIDANFVIDEKEQIIEIQATAEKRAFSSKELIIMTEMANENVKKLLEFQKIALNS